MNIYRVTRKEPYYGSGSTHAMVVTAESEHQAARIHPDLDEGEDWEWIDGKDVWVCWRAEKIYRHVEGEREWPGPEGVDVELIGVLTAEWLLPTPQVVLRHYER